MSADLTIEDFKDILVNPFYAVEIAPVHCVPHEPVVDKETFAKSFAISIMQDDNGNPTPTEYIPVMIERQVVRMLEVLEGSR